MPHELQDSELLEFASSVNDHTVIITGGASGIGRQTAFLFARYGAKVVVGDINEKAADETVSEIVRNGGQAIWRKCNVLDYDEQVQLFEAAKVTFKSVDIVIPCAGLHERHVLTDIQLDNSGLPMKPDLVTFDVNFTSVLYSAQLAYHFFQGPNEAKNEKALVILASMLGLTGLQRAAVYCSSKHALIALMRSLKPDFEARGFRISAVCPWFVDTPLVPTRTRHLLTGMPLVPLQRVADMTMLAATDKAEGANGAAYTTPDSGLVFRMASADFDDEVGFNKALADRLREQHRQTLPESILVTIAFLKLFRAPLISMVALYAAGRAAYKIVRGGI